MRAFAPAVFAVITLVGTPAFADKLPLPKASFSADVTFESKGRQSTGRINVDGPKERRDIKNANGQSVVAIIRRDKGRVYNLKPQRHLAIALRVAAAEATGDIGVPGVDIDALYGAEATPQGTETIAGLQATKYGIEIKENGDLTVDATVWCTDDGIILRMIGKTSLDADFPPARMELKNIVKGPQDAALFEVPPGMSVLSTDGDSDTPEAPAPVTPPPDAAPAVTAPAAAPASPAAAVPPPADKKP